MYISLRSAPTGATDSTRGSRSRRRVPATVLTLGIVSLLTDVSSESVSAILPLYITAVLGMGPLAYGFVDGIYQGVSSVVRLAGGVWSDRTRAPKWVALLGYLVSALSKVGLLLASGFVAISSVVAVDRLGKGLRTGPRDAMIATSSEPADLGRNFGVHRALDTAGAMVGPLVAFAVLAAIPIGLGGYRTVFVISTAFAVVGVVVLALFVPDVRVGRLRNRGATTGGAVPEGVATEPPTSAPRPVGRPRTWAQLADPRLRRVLYAAGALGLVTVGDGFLYLALADGGALATTYFPLLFVGTSAAYLALAVPFGRLADRYGRARVFLAGHGLLFGAYLVVALQLVGTAGAVLVLLLLGAFYASTDGVLSALVTRLVPEESRATGLAAAQTVVALSRFGSSIVFGLLWQVSARETAISVMAIGLVVALVLAVWLLRPLLDRREVAP